MLKLRDVFNKKRGNWVLNRRRDVLRGKVDKNPASKALLFIPLTVMVSVFLIIMGVVGIPMTMKVSRTVWNWVAPVSRTALHGSAEEYLFTDVKADSSLFDALAYLKKHGVIDGYEDNTFRADNQLTRAELVKLIVNAKKQYPLALNYSNCFKDVKTQWFAAPVCLAKDKGWVGGYSDGAFRPNAVVTRAEAVKMILQAFKIKKIPDVPVGNMFEDIEQNYWFYPYMEIALSRKLVNENPNLEFYRPEEAATRGFAAQIIYRVLQS